jgi:hypothetical protein
VDFYATSAQVLPVLYLAIVLDIFGRQGRAVPGTPMGLGFRFDPSRSKEYRGWLNAQLILVLIALGFAGEACALAGTGRPIIAAALAYFGVLLIVRPLIWAFQQVANDWMTGNADGIAHSVFVVPPLCALIAFAGVAIA